VRGPSAALLARVPEAVRAIKATTPLEVAVSLGILTDAQFEILVAAGVDKVNHNLETSQQYFHRPARHTRTPNDGRRVCA